ncbi:alpha/beta hydrolase [Sporosarcina sp. PTS2304]|uniref:alpha/beta hydrolase n=1 Tax=Sporosarcina sp. PTS2304 TaxID=2283194 RepID=UPI000E0D5B0C|nr:alpha/beta hydrolase [Sporosarcina sp. PTS2304]AXI00027.1 alpha/beta hydrolase [Sporosarcina sp. PTS2304]
MRNITIEKNIVYGEAVGEYVTADLYYPQSHDRELPVVVLIHGGAFQSGSKEMYRSVGSKLATDGYFVMAINYRLSTPASATYPGALEDVGQAMNWIVLHANERGLDPLRIGIIGDSAGAYLATMFSLTRQPFSYRICAVVAVYGIFDLSAECREEKYATTTNMFEQFLGIPYEGNVEAFDKASPISHVEEAIANPIFDTDYYLIWGKTDPIINPNQSIVFYEHLKKAKIQVITSEIPDKGHLWFNELPTVEGGTVDDYPNTIIYPKILCFLEGSVWNSLDGNFSRKQIAVLDRLKD